MTPLPVLTDDLLVAALTCRHKAYLKLWSVSGEPLDYGWLQDRLAELASRRKVRGPLLSEGGIKDQLLLLSLFQTLRYRNISFWKFLLSGETDLAAFTAREGRGPVSLAVAPEAHRRGRSGRSAAVLSPELKLSPEARPEGTTHGDADHS
jgi:hypothetical protein